MIESIIGIGLGIFAGLIGLIVLKQCEDINTLQKMYADMQRDIRGKANLSRLQTIESKIGEWGWEYDARRLYTIESKVWEHERYVTAMCTYLNVSGVQEPSKFVLKDK